MTRALALALAAAVVLTAGCSGARQAAVPNADAAPGVPDAAVPPTLDGLTAAEEDVSEQFDQAADRAFVTAVRLWSLREGERLRATISVERFAPDASPQDRAFQRSVVSQIGRSEARPRKIDDQVVWVTPGNRQTLHMWFRGLYLVIMSVSVDHPTPRRLVRAAVREVRP